MPYNKISPKTPTKTPTMMPKVDVDEDESESSNVDEKYDVGGGYVGKGGVHWGTDVSEWVSGGGRS